MRGVQSRKGILLFAARALAWLVPCFAAWYWLAPWLDRPAVWLAEGWIGLFREGLLSRVEVDGRMLNFVTSVVVQAAPGERGVLVVDVNPQLSTYGAPFLAALVLASRGGWRRLVLGLALLVPFQAWSLGFDFLANLLRVGREVALEAGLLGWRGEFAALAYQLGSLLFPTLVPVALWVAMQGSYVRELAGTPAFERTRIP